MHRSAVSFIFALLFLALFVPFPQVCAGQQVTRIDGYVVENPRIVIHIYSNKTVQIILQAETNAMVKQEYIEKIQWDKILIRYNITRLGNYSSSAGTMIKRYWFDGDAGLIRFRIYNDVRKSFGFTDNTTGEFIYNVSTGKYIYRYTAHVQYYDKSTGQPIKTETVSGTRVFQGFDVPNKLWQIIVRDTFLKNSSLRYVGSTKYRFADEHRETYVYNITIAGDPHEYYKLYAEVLRNDAGLGMMATFIDTFMDKLVVPNMFVHSMGFGEVKIVFPMIRWYGGVLGDVAGFFMDNYNLSSSTPVVIVAGEGVSVSATETTLGELGEVKVAFETTSVSGSGQTSGEGANTMLYGLVGVLVVVIVVVTLVLVRRKK